ncbi:hypothetical protein V6N11_072210 [Hibiscus sabdariffa]|uniref:Uncharacterized protein n=1 Tax=Hibiscus sabdariffa TaxID=183260 RepID=A0ABR2U2C5_9ROSI
MNPVSSFLVESKVSMVLLHLEKLEQYHCRERMHSAFTEEIEMAKACSAAVVAIVSSAHIIAFPIVVIQGQFSTVENLPCHCVWTTK